MADFTLRCEADITVGAQGLELQLSVRLTARESPQTVSELVKVSHTEDGNVNASREKICGELNVFCTLTFVKAD